MKSWLSLITHISNHQLLPNMSIGDRMPAEKIDHQQLERMICDCCGNCAGEATPGGKLRCLEDPGLAMIICRFPHDLNRSKSQASLVKNPMWIHLDLILRVFRDNTATSPFPRAPTASGTASGCAAAAAGCGTAAGDGTASFHQPSVVKFWTI